MGTRIFLGKPPANIEQWIKDHHGPVVKETTVVKYTAASGLPDWEGDIVGELASSSIPNKSNIAEVEIGSHVTSIGQYAFYGCSGLTSVTIPDSVASIGSGAFYDCSCLACAIINGKTELQDQVFFNCPNLHEIWMPAYTVDEVVSHTTINEYGYSDWWIGFTKEKLVMVIIYCMDGTVVLNANDDSSGESSGS